ARPEEKLFGTNAEAARSGNILGLRWNRPRFGLCGHLSRAVKTQHSLGRPVGEWSVCELTSASSLLLAGVPCPLRRHRCRWVVCAFLPTGLSELRHCYAVHSSRQRAVLASCDLRQSDKVWRAHLPLRHYLVPLDSACGMPAIRPDVSGTTAAIHPRAPVRAAMRLMQPQTFSGHAARADPPARARHRIVLAFRKCASLQPA